MSRKRIANGIGAAMLMTGLLVACAGATPEPTVAPTPTPAATVTVEAGVRRFVVAAGASTASYIVHEEFFAGALAKYGIEAGNQEVVGSTNAVSGELKLRLDDPQNALVAGQFTVELPTLTTTRNQRDTWIRDNALESNRFPIAAFVATGIANAPSSYTEGQEVSFQLLGDLTVRDITQPAIFDVTATLSGDTITGVATTDMQITDFGFNPPNFANTLTVANDLTIRLDITAHESTADCGCDTQ